VFCRDTCLNDLVLINHKSLLVQCHCLHPCVLLAFIKLSMLIQHTLNTKMSISTKMMVWIKTQPYINVTVLSGIISGKHWSKIYIYTQINDHPQISDVIFILAQLTYNGNHRIVGYRKQRRIHLSDEGMQETGRETNIWPSDLVLCPPKAALNQFSDTVFYKLT